MSCYELSLRAERRDPYGSTTVEQQQPGHMSASHIPSTLQNNEQDEISAVRNLTENIRDQNDLQREIITNAENAILDEEDKRDEQRIQKADHNKQKLEAKRAKIQCDMNIAIRAQQSTRTRALKMKLRSTSEQIQVCNEEIHASRGRIEQRRFISTPVPHRGIKLDRESTKEHLVRTGKITPFANILGDPPTGARNDLAEAIVDAKQEPVKSSPDEQKLQQNFQISDSQSNAIEFISRTDTSESTLRPRKKRRIIPKFSLDEEKNVELGLDLNSNSNSPISSPASSYSSNLDNTPSRRKDGKGGIEIQEDILQIDDGNEAIYATRLREWVESRRRSRRLYATEIGVKAALSDTEQDEWFKPHPQHPDYIFNNGIRLPGNIYKVLFNYQKTGVQWLCELYEQKVGGILGDEMGLGKTVQAVSFVAALHYSKKLWAPALIVVPATLMRQWVNEFHKWWPPLRVSILHSSGSGMTDLEDESLIEDEEATYDERRTTKTIKATKIINRVITHGHVLITTYAGLQTYASLLHGVEWGYAILDEGHKIRNPNTAVTIACKQLKTPHRIILSGTPMQNNLTELWSIFDFIYPFRLGTLFNFKEQFDIPIKQGGYANSSNLQIMAAQKCAEVLKEIISPYLLQRVKADVAQDLPKKTEQVLFCKLTETQTAVYNQWLHSETRELILQQKVKALVGIDILRKICNHPDLTLLNKSSSYGLTYGDPEVSGKMQVVKGLLMMWKRLHHKCLIFSQSVQMLDILQKFVQNMEGIKFLRMDGTTAVKDRQKLVNQFNKDITIDAFLLTTRVGGLGLNLTSASRVVLFDPDWNPSTDAQAQERAWRLGQKNDVHIFRLLTTGTIEEKIYERQIFKTVLANKVLKDPTQRSSFQVGDLEDLFTLGTFNENGHKLNTLFKDSERKIEGDESYCERQSRCGMREKRHGDEDIEHIVGVASLQSYEDRDETTMVQEDRLMQGIFSKVGVTSTLKHERVVNGRVMRANELVLQREAREVASRARANLRRLEEKAQNIPIGTVTWTGQFGTAGLPSQNSRQRRAVPDRLASVSIQDRDLQPPSTLGKRNFATMITHFIRKHNNRAQSKALVDHFNPYCTNKRQSELFKAALNEVAILSKVPQQGSSLKGFWRLREG